MTTVVPHPRDSGTLFLGTYNRGLFESEDCGTTFRHVNTGANGDKIDSGGIGLVIDPVHPDVMYATMNYGSVGFWKSTNGGADWAFALSDEVRDAFQYDFVEGAAMDPLDPMHLVVSPHGACLGKYAPSCMAETTDGASTWRLFSAPAWEEGSLVSIIGGGTWLLPTVFKGLQRTTDAGATWNPVPDVGGAYSTLERDARGDYFLPSPGGIVRSKDAVSWSTIAGSPGNCPAFALTASGFFACGLSWDPIHCRTATASAPAVWTDAPVPSDLVMDGRPAFNSLSYDYGHQLLFGTAIDNGATTFQGGAWRMVMP